MRNIFRWNFIWNSKAFIQENVCGNVVCKIAAILSQPQCVNTPNLQLGCLPHCPADLNYQRDELEEERLYLLRLGDLDLDLLRGGERRRGGLKRRRWYCMILWYLWQSHDLGPFQQHFFSIQIPTDGNSILLSTTISLYAYDLILFDTVTVMLEHVQNTAEISCLWMQIHQNRSFHRSGIVMEKSLMKWTPTATFQNMDQLPSMNK